MLTKRFGTRWSYLSKGEAVVMEANDELVIDMITRHNCAAQAAGSASASFSRVACFPPFIYSNRILL